MTARNFALVMGIVFVVIGIAGFIPGLVQPLTEEGAPELALGGGHGLLLGIFPVNWLHNLVHLAFGIWGLAAYRSHGGAVLFSRATAVIYAVFAVMGFIPILWTTFGLVPLYGNDIWLHAIIAAVAAYFGWGKPAKQPATAARTTT